MGAKANKEVVSSLEGLAVQVSPADELVGVDHPGDSQRGPVLKSKYLQLPSRRQRLLQRLLQVQLQSLTEMPMC
ncbi:hypothetical protein ACOSQ3_022696 [Xanthoceras sorbifolium]